jgi:ornithine cyclodeaminase
MPAQISAELLRELTPWPALIEAISTAFQDPCETPARSHYDVRVPGAETASLLLMPAWTVGGVLGVKVVQVFPGNSQLGKPSISGIYMLASAVDGGVYALIDAPELTARRTAATSALASRFLSRDSSRRLLVLGTGMLSFNMVAAHASVRSLGHVAIWGRNKEKALGVASRVQSELDIDSEVVDDLPAAVRGADIVSTVTTSTQAILPGRFLRAGTHVDLVGGFTPKMREADDDVIRSARVYVDTLQGAAAEAGDIAIPIARGIMQASDIRGDLSGLCQRRVLGRASDSDITVFKSVGCALEDLAAAALAWAALQASRPRESPTPSRKSAADINRIT